MTTPSLRLLAVVSLISTACVFSSCRKDTPEPPPPPVDSTKVVDLKKGLLLFLPFSGSFADSSGNNNPVAAVGGAALTYNEHGYANSAFGGTGTGQKLVVTNNGSIKFDSTFSLSLNFMERQNYNRQTLMVMVKDVDAKGVTFGVSNAVPGIPNLAWGVVYGSTDCDQYGDAPANIKTDTTSFIPQPDAWYNVICTFNKGKLQMYINGSLISEKISPSQVTRICPDAQIIIGGWWQNDPASIDGKIDEVRLYNRVLTADEIAHLSRGFHH